MLANFLEFFFFFCLVISLYVFFSNILVLAARAIEGSGSISRGVDEDLDKHPMWKRGKAEQ